MMDSSDKVPQRKRFRILGWVSSIIGGLFTLFGLLIMLVEIEAVESDWYVGILLISIPSFVIGLPLLVLGIRRIKKPYETKKKKINWAWPAAIIGGFMTSFGFSCLLIGIFSTIYEKSSYLECSAPSLLLGIPLMVLGIRNIIKEKTMGKSNTEGEYIKRTSSRVWGWIFIIVGGLSIIIGVGYLFFVAYVFFVLSPQKGYMGPYEGYLIDSFYLNFFSLVLPVIIIGLTLVILGDLMVRKTILSRQSRGWTFLIIGIIYLFATLLSITSSLKFIQEQLAFISLYLPLFLILGTLGLFFGIKDLISTGKISSVKIDISDTHQQL